MTRQTEPTTPYPAVDRRTAVAGVLSAALAGPALARAAIPRPPRQVLGFYYGWYATPALSGHWAHWQGPTGQEAPSEKPNFDHPTLGLYDSHDPKVAAQHARWLKQAGLTGIISGQWSQDSFQDRSAVLMLDAMQAQGMTLSVYLESQKRAAEGAYADLLFLVTQRATHPAWLKAAGRPVIFLYAGALRDLPAADWRQAARRVAAAGHAEPILIGDVSPDGASYADSAVALDGTHDYLPAPYLAGKTPAQITAFTDAAYPAWKKKAQGRIYCCTVMPGYNDSKVPGRPQPRPIVDRAGGETLAATWRAAIKTGADYVLVTSFNAWNDGTEIEPSQEWGEAGLQTNRGFAQAFLRAR